MEGLEEKASRVNLQLKTGNVYLYFSYNIKEELKTLGFRFDSTEKAWYKPESELRELLESTNNISSFERTGIITVKSILELIRERNSNETSISGQQSFHSSFTASPSHLSPSSPTKSGQSYARLELSGGMVMVYNSYDIKEELKSIGFRFNGEEKAWYLEEAEIRRYLSSMLGVDWYRDNITVDLLLRLCRGEDDGTERNVNSSGYIVSESANAMPHRPFLGSKSYIELFAGMVVVHDCYDIKDYLKGLGFRYSPELKGWHMDEPEIRRFLTADMGCDWYRGPITVEHLLKLCGVEKEKVDTRRPTLHGRSSLPSTPTKLVPESSHVSTISSTPNKSPQEMPESTKSVRLTPEQKERIERNKQAAIARRLKLSQESPSKKPRM